MKIIVLSNTLRLPLTIAASFLIGICVAQAWELVYAAQNDTVTTPDFAGAIPGLIIALATIITTVGSLITWLVGKLKNTHIYSTMDERARVAIDTIGDIAKSMQDTDKGVAEHADMIKGLAAFVAQTPAGKQFLEENGLAMEKFTQDVKDWNSDLKAFYLKVQPLPDDESDDSKIRALTKVRKNFVPAPEMDND
jgi:hypothetical protein